MHSEIEHFYRECMRDNHIPGIAYGLVVDQKLAFSGGFGSLNNTTNQPVTGQSLFRIASMTKSFTAMAVLMLREEGKLMLTDPISKYIPELADLTYLTKDATQVTIYNLLTMTAGFPEDNPWGDRYLDITDAELMDLVGQGISFSAIPSIQYEYSNLGYGLLGNLITRISGMPYQQYITGNILIPLGMTHTYWEYTEAPDTLFALGYRWEEERWEEEPILHDGAFGAMGGLITSIEDFSKYVSFHLSAWPPRNDPENGPVRRSTVREMKLMHHPMFYKHRGRFGDPEVPLIAGYGFGLLAKKDLQGIVEVGHNGGLPGYGSNYMFYPDYGIGIMAFGNRTYVGGTVQSANYKVIETLMEKGLFKLRELPVSKILTTRKEQVILLIQQWDPQLEKDIIAMNLYLDKSHERRMKEFKRMFDSIGEIISVGQLIPENELRGSFQIEGTEGTAEIYFTLSPEPVAKIQWLSFELLTPTQ